jgi:hypothetical protein
MPVASFLKITTPTRTHGCGMLSLVTVITPRASRLAVIAA